MSEQNIDRLFERQKQAPTLSEYRRIQCVYLKEKHGYTSTQIADITTYHPASVRRIQSQYRKEGIESLSPKPKGGRNRAHLSLADEQALLDTLRTQAEAGQIIEISQIQSAYEAKVGSAVGKSTVYALLKRHRWRKVVPRPRHPKQNESDVAAFKKNSLRGLNGLKSKRRKEVYGCE